MNVTVFGATGGIGIQAVDAGDDPLSRYLIKPILRRALRESFADLRAAEDVVRSSELAWTILRPPRLTDKPATGRVRHAHDRNLRWASSAPAPTSPSRCCGRWQTPPPSATRSPSATD
jgi:hypothetical protein